MRVNLFISNTSKRAASVAIKNMGASLGGNIIVIVPERHSLETERQIYDTLNLEGSDNIDVVSFSRLALKITKHTLAKPLTREGAIVLLNKIIRENKDKLGYYRAMAGKLRFAAEALTAIDSLKTGGIGPEELERTAPFVKQEQKFLDIAYLYRAYDEALSGKYSDALTRLDALTDAIPDSDLIAASDIYVLGQNFFDNKQKAIISNLIKHAASFNIAICEPVHNRYFREFSARETILELAKEAQAPVGITEEYDILPEPIHSLCARLFTYENAPPAPCGGRMVLSYESNPYEEIKGIGKEIAALVREGKYRYKDIALICPDRAYKSVIKDIFSRFDIPIYIDIKYPLISDVFTLFLASALEAAFAPAQRNMCALAKHPFSELNGEEFEDYCVKYNIDFDYFLKEFTLGEERQKAEETRLRLCDIIKPLKNTEENYQAIAAAVMNFIDSYAIHHQKFLQSEGLDASIVSASGQAGEKIKNIIRESALILGDTPCTLEEFYSTLKAALAEAEISVIPQYIDAVFAGGLQEAGFNDVKVLFFAGANQGAYPAIPPAQSVINLYDIEALAARGLQLYPAPAKVMERERFIILDTLTKARDKVYISCSAYDLSGGALKQSELYKDALRLTDADARSLFEKYQSMAAEGDFIKFAVNSRNLFYEYTSLFMQDKTGPRASAVEKYLRERGYGYMLDKMAQEDKSIDQPLKYFFSKEGDCYTTKVSQLESYFNCPYLHFFSYGLRLKDKEKGLQDAREIGTTIHTVLELFFDRYKDSVRDMSDGDIARCGKSVIEEVLNDPRIQAQMNTPMGKRLFDIVRRECEQALFSLTKNIQKGSYTPRYAELQFGMQEGYPGIELQAEGERFLLRGKIDRVDMYKDNVIIIDYKTGKIADYCDFANLYNGTKIQLFVYLAAFLKEGLIPRGVFYLPISLNYSSAPDIARFRMSGFFDASPEGIRMLEQDLLDGEERESEVADFKIKTTGDNGVIIKKAGKRALNTEEFALIADYVLKVSARALAEIKGGYIERRPYNAACQWCNYASICQDTPVQRNKHSGIKKENLLQKDD